MIFYSLVVVLLLLIFVISYLYPNLEKYTNVSVVGILIFIGGFRDRIGYDYGNYINWYVNNSRSEGLGKLEFGYSGLMKLLRMLDLNYLFLFFIISFFTYFFVYLGLRLYSNKITLPLILYALIPSMFLYSFTYIRQFLAVTIAFYAFNLLLEKKYFWFIITMFIGVSFHYTCLIPFVVFLLVFKFGETVNWKYMYVLLGLTFILSRFGVIYLLSVLLKNSHYLYYVSNDDSYAVPLLKLIVFNSFVLGIMLFFNKYGFENQKQKYFLILCVISICILNLFSESIELTRIYVYFRIFEICLVSDIVYKLLKNRQIWLVGIIALFYVLPFFMALNPDTVNPELDNFKLVPYRSILLK
jgi:hypothetical protein